MTGGLLGCYGTYNDPEGAFAPKAGISDPSTPGGQYPIGKGWSFDNGRVVPTGATNLPRSWGALASVYLGHPATA